MDMPFEQPWGGKSQIALRAERSARRSASAYTFHSDSWLPAFSPQAQAQGLDLSMVGFETPRRALWVGASSPTSHNALRLAGPSTAFWGKSATAAASDPEPIECYVDLTSPNCPAR